MIGYSIDDLRFHDDPVERNQIGNENADLLTFVEDIKRRLLPKWNFP
jgi:hypothetical protein